MAIVYSTEIQVLRGAPSLGELTNVIKEVEFLINRSIQEQKIPTNVVMEKPWL